MTTKSAIRLLVVEEEQVGTVAADVVLSALPSRQPRIGVATGATPLTLYWELGRRVASGAIDLRESTLVALDEYVGLGQWNPRSFAAYVRDVIAEPLHVAKGRVLVPDGLASDPDRAADAFEEAIATIGGIDVQIAGLGTNGHIGFNEPGSALDSSSRTVELTEQTRRDNARFFGDRLSDVPTQAITQGLGTISRARSIVLVVKGVAKARALQAAVHGPVTLDVPASVLQRHPAVTVIADREAAGELRPREEHHE
jgi:glucosamine-6-phosphate deaminase